MAGASYFIDCPTVISTYFRVVTVQGPTTWSLPGASLSPNVLGKLQTVDPSLESGTQTSGCSTRRGMI